MNPTQDQDLTRRVIELAEKIHTRVGPGLFGEAYETCLAIELTAAGLPFEQGRVVPIIYKGHELDYRCQMDFLVGETLVVQIESVDEIEYNHEAELRTAVHFGGFTSGLLLNFNVVELREGIRQIDRDVTLPPPGSRDVFDDPDLLASL